MKSLAARAALRELLASLSRNSDSLGAELIWRAEHYRDSVFYLGDRAQK